MSSTAGPVAPRPGATGGARRAIVAVLVSLLVAAGVATPLALRVAEGPGATTTTAVPTTVTTATSTAPPSSDTTVPVRVLGETTINDGG